ncbi:hypothetical protein [Fodinicola feengrottensis]|uniref:hypothetical protein n=1 Tax=Fodinicola feengrottensis TaxID=435914 RepID=UPI002440F7B5|nr:hypothetical protein [Fodinicola feengrottensis]
MADRHRRVERVPPAATVDPGRGADQRATWRHRARPAGLRLAAGRIRPHRSTLVEGWHTWWHAVAGAADSAPLESYGPPDFAGLAGSPALAAITRARWEEAHRWHRRRKRHGIAELRPSETNLEVVASVEREIGHPAAPFEVEFVILPVLDDEIRRVRDLRFLVPERVYTSARWPQWLHGLVRSVA